MTALDWAKDRRHHRRPREIDREIYPVRKERSLSKADEEAIRFAREYKGSFEFMIKIRLKAQHPNWRPTDNQRQAILNCKRFEASFTPPVKRPARGRVRFVG
jgi:hypothetical protein